MATPAPPPIFKRSLRLIFILHPESNLSRSSEDPSLISELQTPNSELLLNVARQTVIRDFVLGVAVHAPIHRHVHPWLRQGFFTLSNISVTGRTGYLSQNDMTAMRKEDVVRLFIY